MLDLGARSKSGAKWVSLLLVPALVLLGVSSGGAAPPSPGDGLEIIEMPPGAFSLSGGFALDVQEGLNPALDSTLNDVSAAARVSVQAALDLAQARSLRTSGGRVHVQIVVQALGLQAILDAIAAAGGEVTGVGSDGALIQGWLPVESLDAIASQDGVQLVRRPAQAVLFAAPDLGNSVTEGLVAMNADAWHANGHTGSGVKIGVIDGGFSGYTSLLGTDLPASVIVGNFVDGEGESQVDGSSAHGTACAEIVHDVAPSATIYLAKVSTNLDLVEAVTWLSDTHHVDVISTSLGWYNLTPGDGTGEFADLVQSARDAGILWATAAGNDRESHWGGQYADADFDDVHEFNGPDKEVNCFGPGGSSCYNIDAGYVLRAYLRWNDWTNVDQDYDLYLVRLDGSSWTTVASSTNTQNGGPGQTPTEYAVTVSSGSATAYGVVVQRASGSGTANLELFVPKAPRLNELLHPRSLANLVDAPDAITVAALDSTSPYPQGIV